MSKKDIEAIYALSPVQEGMLFHSLFAPDSGVYVQQMSCTLKGNFNLSAFESAWQRLIERHPILRTAFVWQGIEKPLQVVQKYVNLSIQKHDWRNLSPSEQEEQLATFLQSDQNQDFNLAQAPLMRLTLIQVKYDTYHLIWTHHHLLLDGWSTPLLFNEVFTYYEAFSAGQELCLPLSRPYRDYITWLKRQDISAAEAYWRQMLGGIDAPTQLALDRGANVLRSTDYGEQEVQLSLSTTTALSQLAAKHQLTLNTFVQAAWALLLSRHSSQEDVVFGTTVSGRPADLRDVESMIGLFINTLPMRVQVSANDRLLPWLKKFQNQQVELRQYEYSSLVQIHGWSDIPRHLSLFESIVVFESYPLNSSLQERAISLSIQDVRDAVKTNYPLTLVAVPESQLLLRIKYDVSRFDTATAIAILSQLQSLLDQFAKNPEQLIASYSLVTPASRALLPDPTKALPEPKYELVNQMLATWLQKSNERPAVCQGQQLWSYGELATSAHALAQALLTQGLKRGDTVAVLGCRSFGLIASMIGVLLSGGVLLTVDRNLPIHRQRLMLQQANAKYAIIFGEQLLEELSSVVTIKINPDTGEISQPTHDNEILPLPELSPDDPAYIFFTSGTTGVPKGILGSHKGLAHFLTWQRQTFAVGSQDRCAQLINISFDVVLRDIFLPLVSGATLCLPDDEEVLASDRIFCWLEREKITLLHTVPAIAQSWLINPAKNISLPNLRHIFFAGEPLTEALVSQWRAAFPTVTGIVNLYGPTETTLAKCFYLVPPEILPGVQPVGQPLPETQALVIAAGKLCGIGESGEIVIRTPFRSLGYINAFNTRKSNFVKNFFRDDQQDLLYYTGDRGYYRADGLLEIKGRLDNQIKIRGVRVELDEVTAALAQHPSVKSGIAHAIKDEQGQNILVGYIVSSQPSQELLTDLRANLSQRLSAAMVPSAFVFLEQLPLTANGKVNRQALPMPDLENVTADTPLVMPQTPVEEIVAGIWSQVLSVKKVGRHSNFFALGGHSLLATQLISRVRDTFEIEMPLRRIFEAPTVAELTACIADAQRSKHGLLALPLQPVSRNQDLPLSFAQQRLWFLDQLEPESSVYNIPGAMQISGSLNVSVLEQSLSEIVRRHEVFRTTFITVAGQAFQVVHPVSTWSLPVVNLRHLPASDRKVAAMELTNGDAQQPFDLRRGPLLRTTLLCLDENEHILLLTMHHIIADAWSLDILFHELVTIYQAFAVGKPSLRDATRTPLPELPIQYADFAYWQRQWLQGQTFETQLAYWKQQLNGNLPILDVPTDRPRPPVQTFRGARRSRVLSLNLTQALKQLSQQAGVTLFMTLLTAFKTLLYRYTHQEDIAVGTPIAGRTKSEIEGLIGFFVNTLVLRTDLSGNPTFRELLSRVREVALGAYAHQDLPFEKLVEELQPERHLSHTPLFQVMFVLQNTGSQEPLTLPGVSLSPLSVEESTAKFDLTLVVQEQKEELVATLEYNTDLFEPATAERMLGHWQTLLESVVANPEQRLLTLPVLTATERHQLLVEWNDTKINYVQQCIHELFAAQVEQTPDAVAVVFANKQLTYRELNNRANQLAHYLQQLGVGPDVLVGICVERTLEMIIGLLGILKAGGAYVPLDPTYPQERLSFMLSDSQVQVLLTQQKLVESNPCVSTPNSALATKLVCLDTDWELINQQSKNNPNSEVTPENLAYVIYTSGSTGRPKGVLIQHQGVCNLAQLQVELFDIQQHSRVLQFASLSFDASVWEIFMALCSGASLYLGTQDSLRPGADLMQLLQEQSITHVTLPPTALAALPTEELPNLQTLIVAGEACNPKLVAQWSKGRRFFNAYGPTESTVCATVAECTGDTQLPIGRAIANTQVYILDQHLQPVPIGIPGELYIGGDGLARGYLNRPELTAERFIANPFQSGRGDGEMGREFHPTTPPSHHPIVPTLSTDSQRLYKTGDLARYLPDGNIEYVHRLDNQVKIRGFRIELGEIEAVLNYHPAVRENTVVVREEVSGDKRLVAYIVPNSEQISTAQLRHYLQEKLPEYMVPNYFVMLDALPLTPNGKIDRKALPAPDSNQELEAYVAPASPIEEIVAGIWSQVLGVKQVGRYGNFFALGGHSLLATQLVSRVRDTFQMELPLRCLFESPTVAGLANCIADAQLAANNLLAPPLQPVSRNQDLPLSFAQQRLWFLEKFAPGSSAYNISGAIQVTGSLNLEALEQSLSEIIRRHEALRTTFTTVQGQALQVINPPPTWSLPVVNLQNLPVTEQEATALQLAKTEAQQPFDLKQPLLRVQLLRLGEEKYIVLFTMHHIISDAWSMDIFIRELATLYTTFSKGQPSPLADLSIQYADFASWQRQWLQGEILEAQLGYWQQQLSGSLPVLELPFDRPRPAVQTFRGAQRSLLLPASLTKALKQLSQQEGVTLFMTLLAAYKTLLWRYTNQEDILVGSPIAGRNQSQIEGLIGFFVNTLVLRTDLSGNPTFRTLLNRVREVALGAYAHQDLPFERLVEELQPERHLSHSPLFQVMFVLQNTAQEPLTLLDVTLSPLSIADDTAKFDLTLFVEQGEELVATLEYNTDLFDTATAEQMLGHWQTLLENIVANPNQRLADIVLLTAAQKSQLLNEWNATQTTYPQNTCIHSLFERQVEQTPDKIAVRFANESLTYEQLNHRANQLAYYLRSAKLSRSDSQGIGAETFVGICMERNLDMIVGMLGILKAGAAYVPLDPKYPQERLAFMLGDTQASVLLTQQRLLTKLPEHHAQVICVDSDWQMIATESVENPESEVTAKNLAYAIYTSGSTGKPKGVAIAHSNTVAFLTWASSVFTPADLAGVLAATSICFDLSIFEIFLPLSNGGKVILAENALQLPHLPAAGEVTLVNTVPSAIAELIRVGGLPSSVQTVNLAGEPLLNSLVQQIYQQQTVQQVFNLYGPSEDTTYSTFALVEKGSTKPTPIGRPVANTQVYLLDAHLQPVPVGVPGELYIGGEGLARCYLHLPAMTAEKFIPNPFSTTPGVRLYKTGDLARYLPNGEIEYLGRLDHQVKVRGFRIELGEIESMLSYHPGVQENVVLVRDDVPGDQRLVAYIVPQQSLTISELRHFLKQKLPDYMVPTGFVMLESLPLTPNGKVDRRALPAPDQTRPDESTFVAPRTFEEAVLAGIWAKVLKLEQVGVHDNFFHLGGHSLTAIQVMSQINEVFQTDLPLRHLFETPTVAGLALAIEQGSRGEFPTPNSSLSTQQRQSAQVGRPFRQSLMGGTPKTALPHHAAGSSALKAEAVLDPAISPGNLVYQPMAEPSAIFLTGATGFLGAFLLADLLEETQADVYCLVRSASVEEGKQRLQRNLEFYLLWKAGFNSRIIPVLGDLSEPHFGLSIERFQILASRIDIIYHNGALVNHVYPYALLKAANVQGTEEVLKLASLSKIKPVHFISTTSVFSSEKYFQVGVVKENDALEYSQGLAGGYVQSKWVAEKLMMIARDRGLPCCIYRFGRVGWHSQTGVWNTNDMLYRLIKGCIQLGSVPDFDRTMEITPVDYISKAIVHLSQQQELLGKAFHLVNSQPVPWSKFVDSIRAWGYSLPQLAYTDWEAQLIQSTKHSADNALSPLVAFAEASTEEQAPDEITSIQFDCQNTLAGLRGTSITCPEVNDELFNAFFSEFVRSQVVDIPQLNSVQNPQGEKDGTTY
ncbi:non-ribosomal peptide synthetase [Nostoc sp.]|uniref:non-ribosomal peptide synthetase n=1 Tax=Nostoc sp. TaxID=1180 RepID=UPI002FF5D77A